MSKILIVFGTRPELIKLAPVIFEFKRRNLHENLILLNTGQHEELLAPYLKMFDIKPDFSLDIMVAGQNLSNLTAKAIIQLQSFLDSLKNTPNWPAFVIAQGDTTTVMAASMVAFYNQIKFAHLEAGLRTHDLENPFPEEFNRKVAGITSDVHFAPTEISKSNLLREGFNENKIHIVGNTIVDALEIINNSLNKKSIKLKPPLEEVFHKGNIILITCHRRENHGNNLQNIIRAIETLSAKYKDFNFIWTLHPNPNVRDVVKNSALKNKGNVFLVEPLDYMELINLFHKTKLIITDSGGIQEEAPSFGIPVLVTREKTERPEGLLHNYSFLVGADVKSILKTFEETINRDFEIAGNPYGDGKASLRIVDFFQKYTTTL